MLKLLKIVFLPLALASTSLPVAATCASQPYVGEVCTFGFNFCPVGYAETAGQLMAIAENETLFNLIGTTFGGDGVTTFALPDLRGRTVVGVGAGAGLSPVTLNQTGGQESVTLSTTNLPAHTHSAGTKVTSTLNGINTAGALTTPQANVLAQPSLTKSYAAATTNVTLGKSSISSTGKTRIGAKGGNQPFDNRRPYLGMTTCIALFGIFPSPN